MEMNTQKTKKNPYPLERRQAELQELVKHTKKCVRGIELDLSSGKGSVATFREKGKTLRQAMPGRRTPSTFA